MESTRSPRVPSRSVLAEELVARMRRGDAAGAVASLALIRALLERPPAATWHPTGFIVLQPHRDADGALRVHLWPAGAREHGQPCWPVHDHVWHLCSEVLCGTVHSQAYAVEDDDEGEAVLYAVVYGEGQRSCMRRSERRARIREEGASRVAVTERYSVPAGVFHASRVFAGELAATLVCTQVTDRPYPWVVGPSDGPPEVEVVRPQADTALVVRVLEEVEARLSSAVRRDVAG